jgi:hypothetical protein
MLNVMMTLEGCQLKKNYQAFSQGFDPELHLPFFASPQNSWHFLSCSVHSWVLQYDLEVSLAGFVLWVFAATLLLEIKICPLHFWLLADSG